MLFRTLGVDYVFELVFWFFSLRYIHRSGIFRSYGSPVFRFFYLHIVFDRAAPIYIFTNSIARVPFSPESTSANQSVWYITLTNWGMKTYNHLNRCRKVFDKIQYPFVIETLQKVGIKEMYHNLIKVTYEKPPPNIILNCEKLKAFPLKRGIG